MPGAQEGQKRDVGSPRTGVTDGCWELNLGALGEQTVLLTSEPSLQALVFKPPPYPAGLCTHRNNGVVWVLMWKNSALVSPDEILKPM